MIFDERFVTDAPPAGAFLYLRDLTNCPSWDPNITRVEQLTPGPVSLGTRFLVTMKMFGMKSTLEYHVEVYEPGKRIIFHGRSFAAKVTDTILVTPFRGGSRIRWTADIRLFAPLALVDPLLAMLVRPTMTKAMASLKQSLNALAPSMAPRQPMPERPPVRTIPPHRNVEPFHGAEARHG